jgi:hypothetical protein
MPGQIYYYRKERRAQRGDRRRWLAGGLECHIIKRERLSVKLKKIEDGEKREYLRHHRHILESAMEARANRATFSELFHWFVDD